MTYLNVGGYRDARRTATTPGVDMATTCCDVTRIDIVMKPHVLYKPLEKYPDQPKYRSQVSKLVMGSFDDA
jgi:hypothetical protein